MSDFITLLVINADDLGLDRRRDQGILEAFERGDITQASLLVHGRNARCAAERANDRGLPLGLHLDLTETEPCAPPSEIRTILDGRGNKLGKHGLRAAMAEGRVEVEHAVREARAQIEKFTEIVGRAPVHVDGHQHIHIEPLLAECLAGVLAQAGVRTTRIPEQMEVPFADPRADRFYRNVIRTAREARPIYSAHGVSSTEAFLGLETMGASMNEEALASGVSRHRGSRSIELMCHPGYAGTGWDEFNASPGREHELSVLRSKPFTRFVDEGWLRPASFEEIAGRSQRQLEDSSHGH